MISALVNIADINIDRGQPHVAQGVIEELAPFVLALGEPGSMSEMERARGLAAIGSGERERALTHLTRGAGLAIEAQSTNNIAACLRGIGEAIFDMDRPRAIEILAYVHRHRSTTPMSRAKVEARLSPEELRQPVPGDDITTYARRTVAFVRQAYPASGV